VHGEIRHQVAHARLAREMQVPRALIPRNGDLLRLAPGRPELIDEVPSGRIHLDGRVLVAEGEGLAKSRRALAHAGLLAISIVLDAKGRVAAMPSVLAEGMPDPVAEAVRRAVEDQMQGSRRNDPDDLAQSVRRVARRAALDAWGKKPVTRVMVTEL